MSETMGGDNATADQKPAQFRVIGQYIKDLSFENPNAPRSLIGTTDKPNVKLDVGVAAKKLGDNSYESTLSFEAKATNSAGVLYNLEVEYAGLFQIENLPNEALEPVLMINCPALLFPFLRRMIADITRDGGYPPLWVDPIDFPALYVQNKKAQAANSVMKPALS